jgi:hypothetical protein
MKDIKKYIEEELLKLSWKDRSYNKDYDWLIVNGKGNLNGNWINLEKNLRLNRNLLKVNLKSNPNYKSEFFKDDFKDLFSVVDKDRYNEIEDYLWVCDEKMKELDEMRKFCLKELKKKDISKNEVDEILKNLRVIKFKNMEFEYFKNVYRKELDELIKKY